MAGVSKLVTADLSSRATALIFAIGLVVWPMQEHGAAAESAKRSPLSEEVFVETRDGDALYARICAGCHLSRGEGAVGAGRYPALAGNARLESAPYAIGVVLDGRGAMPPFRSLLDDAQIAGVLNFVRGPAFGNNARSPIEEADVRRIRR
jgi:mono/diheme cytochrome c family protein